ncbi:hypothetical protein THAOC_11555, partial [Thalassiosira oceanica]
TGLVEDAGTSQESAAIAQAFGVLFDLQRLNEKWSFMSPPPRSAVARLDHYPSSRSRRRKGIAHRASSTLTSWWSGVEFLALSPLCSRTLSVFRGDHVEARG